MDGVHDMGGMHGFGAVPIEVDEPVYHDAWEGRVAAITRRLMANSTVDRFRYTIEQMPPAEYLASRYYERWLWAAERLAGQPDIIEGLNAPMAAPPAGEPASGPRFAPGQRVRVGNPVTPGHTRVPRYIRTRTGTVVRRSCAWPHPTESASTGRHGPMEHVYAVAFDGRDLFGPDAGHVVVVDVWERDLEEAS
jgi:nitrile hydratase subunit beta